MNSISEAREAKKRINDASRILKGVDGDYKFINFDDEEVSKTLDAAYRVLILAWRDLDAMIDEWEEAKEIDRPL